VLFFYCIFERAKNKALGFFWVGIDLAIKFGKVALESRIRLLTPIDTGSGLKKYIGDKNLKTNVTNIRGEEQVHIGAEIDSYYSAEMSFRELNTPYHCKIRKDPSWPLSVLVREDSKIAPLLQVGDIVNVKYYFLDSKSSPKCFDTAIRDITKNDDGRFRGHYLVDLEILSEGEQRPSQTDMRRAVG
jgi:hypothetical protein